MKAGWFGYLWFLVPVVAVAGPVMSPQELDDWFNGKSAAEVNEGSLTFLTRLPDKPIHHHQNQILITPDSLVTGWTDLMQCHDNLDSVPHAQIIFREGYIRDLRVTKTHQIGQAWVEGSSVQLQDVKPGARLCLAAQMRALSNSGGGYYSLHNGPYMRKFLDGYYPMRVTLELSYPVNLLQLIEITPPVQAGFNLQQSPGKISIDTLFEGELRIHSQFMRN